MSVAEIPVSWLMPSMVDPHTPSPRSVSNVPSLTSSCSSSDSYSSSSTPGSDTTRIARRPRGFLRPQATRFSDSARNRESVLNLGSIAHIQHYFARTGLLDGKGAQTSQKLSKEQLGSSGSACSKIAFNPVLEDTFEWREISNSDQNASFSIGSCIDDDSVSGSFITQSHDMLAIAPTTSTYRQVPIHVPAPPTMGALRRGLSDALEDAKAVLAGLYLTEVSDNFQARGEHDTAATCPSQGWHEIEGLHVLDLVTLAIRAAREFYTCHDKPNRLYDVRSERQIRLEIYRVMDVLKRVAARNFTGGYRKEEVETISNWILGVETILADDEAAEQTEQARRENWAWLGSYWHGRERDREWLFLLSFDPMLGTDPLPPWTEPGNDSSTIPPFLTKLRDGTRLIGLHNAIVQSSTRHFGEVTNFHQDTEKPYRRSENLKFWIKAAELRWEVKLDVHVSKVAASEDYDAWKGFDLAVLRWCKALREEITRECSGLSAV